MWEVCSQSVASRRISWGELVHDLRLANADMKKAPCEQKIVLHDLVVLGRFSLNYMIPPALKSRNRVGVPHRRMGVSLLGSMSR